MSYKAIFIGSGAGLPVFPNIPGENLCRVYSANEFLTRINLMHADKFPEYTTPINIGSRVVVIGGGNTAMDAARCALRLINVAETVAETFRFPRQNGGLKTSVTNGGLKTSVTNTNGGLKTSATNTNGGLKTSATNGSVTLIYRRTEQEMPARKAEIEHAKEEGVEFVFLTLPVEFIGDNNGFVKSVKCLKCELGKPDSSGRRRPVPIKGSEFIIQADTVVLALGLKPNPLIPRYTPNLITTEEGDIVVNPKTMETSVANVFAGGDIVGGEGTVIEAMAMGKKAATNIIKRL